MKRFERNQETRLLTVALLVFLIPIGGLAGAVATGSYWFGLVAIAWSGLVFAVLTLRRPWLALACLMVFLPLMTIEISLWGPDITLSADKVVLLTVFLAWGIRRRPWTRFRLFHLLPCRMWGLFLFFVVASTIWVRVDPRQLNGMMELVVLAGIFLFALDTLNEPEDVVSLLPALLFVASLTAFVYFVQYGLFQRGILVPFFFKHGTQADQFGLFFRGSTFAHPNFFAGWLILVFPVTLFIMPAMPRNKRLLIMMAALFQVTALLTTGSEGALIALGLTFMIVLPVIVSRSTYDRVTLSIMIAIILVFLLGVSWDIYRRATMDLGTSVAMRIHALRVGERMVLDHPLLGFGAEGYSRHFLSYERYFNPLPSFRNPTVPLSAHNAYLDIAVSWGLLGLAAFVGLLVSVISAGRVLLRTRDFALSHWLLLGILTGLTAFSLQALTENTFLFSKLASLFWILAAAALVLARRVAPDPASGPEPPSSE